MKIAAFPGQGSQKAGMAYDLYQNFKVVKNLFNCAEDISKQPIKKIIFEGNEEALKDTRISQVAIMLASIASVKAFEESTEKNFHETFQFTAGHSLGEYSSLVASGSLSFEDAVNLLIKRGNAMAEACPEGGAMLAVIGITDFSQIKELADKASTENEKCEVANDNAPGQVILSGHKKALERAMVLGKEDYKAKIIKFLEVSGPFHSSLMLPAKQTMIPVLNSVAFKQPQVKLINNVTANVLEDYSLIANLLANQIVSPVRWRESMNLATELGVKTLVEFGPNKVLSGLQKRINKDTSVYNIETLQDIKNSVI